MEILKRFFKQPEPEKPVEPEYELVRVTVPPVLGPGESRTYSDVASAFAMEGIMDTLRSGRRVTIPSLRIALVSQDYQEEKNG